MQNAKCYAFPSPGAEEVVVISGTFCDMQNIYPAVSSHIPQSTEGCVPFVFFPEA